MAEVLSELSRQTFSDNLCVTGQTALGGNVRLAGQHIFSESSKLTPNNLVSTYSGIIWQHLKEAKGGFLKSFVIYIEKGEHTLAYILKWKVVSPRAQVLFYVSVCT